MWTSFLKARLVCGFPDESLYFNRLQDVYVVHDDDWHETKIYALFTSSWLDTFSSLFFFCPLSNTISNTLTGWHRMNVTSSWKLNTLNVFFFLAHGDTTNPGPDQCAAEEVLITTSLSKLPILIDKKYQRTDSTSAPEFILFITFTFLCLGPVFKIKLSHLILSIVFLPYLPLLVPETFFEST